MASRLRRAGTDLLISLGVLGAVVGVLVSVDPRVRGQLQTVGNVISLDGLGVVGRRLQDLGLTLFDAVRTQSIEHAPFMIFAVVALVLLVAMMRS
jgi:hypothetical protein